MPHEPVPRPSELVEQVTVRLRAAGCVLAEAEAGLLVADVVARGDLALLEPMVGRREAGEPLEHVLGWAELGGLRVSVAPGVFVPRHRSMLLAGEATALAQAALDRVAPTGTAPSRAVPAPPVVLDLCCGTGVLGALVAAALITDGSDDTGPGSNRSGVVLLVASDLDPTAVACARRNLRPYGAQVHLGDLFDAIPASWRRRIDVLIANVPYVPTGQVSMLPAEAREHEARAALDGGQDGLDVLRRVAVQAPDWLRPGGHLLMEVSTAQADDAAEAVARAGLTPRLVHDEDTVVVVGAAHRG